MFNRTRRAIISLLAVEVMCIGGCNSDFANSVASFGGDRAGDRGQIRVTIINNTPHRAVLTIGTFDQTDQASRPDVVQFTLDDAPPTLDPNDSSDIVFLNCGRTLSIGGPSLLARIRSELDAQSVDQTALVEGVDFFEDSASGDDGAPATLGVALPLELLLGLEFTCDSILVFRLEINDPGPEPFRIDFEVIPATSQRP